MLRRVDGRLAPGREHPRRGIDVPLPVCRGRGKPPCRPPGDGGDRQQPSARARSASNPPCRRQPSEPTRRAEASREARLRDRHRVQRPRSRRGGPCLLLRRDPHGRADAGDGRHEGHEHHSQPAAPLRATTHYRDDGQRDGRGSGTMPGSRNGRFSGQAGLADGTRTSTRGGGTQCHAPRAGLARGPPLDKA